MDGHAGPLFYFLSICGADRELVQVASPVTQGNHHEQVAVGQQVSITIDSFPGRTFEGRVVRIADQAGFAPRNVQTADGRTSTVYAVGIRVPDPEADLKPGLPADVTFIPETH